MNRSVIDRIKESIRSSNQDLGSWEVFFPDEMDKAVREARVEKIDNFLNDNP